MTEYRWDDPANGTLEIECHPGTFVFSDKYFLVNV